MTGTTKFRNLRAIADLSEPIKSEWDEAFSRYPNLDTLAKEQLTNTLTLDINNISDLDNQISILVSSLSLTSQIHSKLEGGDLDVANSGFNLLSKIGGKLSPEQLSIITSSLSSRIQSKIKSGDLNSANAGFDLLCKIGGKLSPEQLSQITSSLPSKIQSNIESYHLHPANNRFDLLCKIGGKLSPEQLSQITSSLPSKMQSKIKRGKLVEANTGFDLLCKIKGELSPEQLSQITSSLPSQIQSNIESGDLDEANTGFNLLCKIGGKLSPEQLSQITSSLPSKIQNHIEFGKLSQANDWFDLLSKIGGKLSPEQLSQITSSLPSQIQNHIEFGKLSQANDGFDLLCKIGGKLSSKQLSQITSSLPSQIERNIKLGNLYNVNNYFDFLCKIGGEFSPEQLSQITSSLPSQIERNIKLGNLYNVNNYFDFLCKIGGEFSPEQLSQITSSLLSQIQKDIESGKLYSANPGFDLLCKIGGKLSPEQLSQITSSLPSQIHNGIESGKLYSANAGFDLLCKIEGEQRKINTLLLEYFTMNQECIGMYHPLTPKSLFDLAYMKQLVTSFPCILERKDIYGPILDSNYPETRKLFMKNDKREIRMSLIKVGYPKGELKKVNKLIEIFEEKAIYDYLGQGSRDPHDAVQHTDKLIAMYEAEYGEEKKKLFIDAVLRQSGASNVGYSQLNTFLMQYKSNRRELLHNELNSPDAMQNPKFLSLAQTILEKDNQGELLKSRASLYQIGDICYLLSQKPALQKIDALLHTDNPHDRSLYEYFSTGILSARKKDVQAMLMMYTDPEKFLGLDDSNAPKDFHDSKKPQAMVTDFKHIDMTPADLVSTLPLGIYDALTYFKPMSQTYIADKLGHISKVDAGLSLDQQKLTHVSSFSNATLQKLVQDYNNIHKDKDQMSFRQLKSDLFQLPADQQTWILGQLDMTRYTAQIGAKSDISNRYNGFNCDALGVDHGKKVVMMFNSLCADFCLFEDIPSNDVDNLITTSRLTLNREIPENITTIKSKITANQDPRTLFDKSVTQDPDTYVLTLDNIEADANFAEKSGSDTKKKDLLKEIYTNFFSEYIQQNPCSPKGIPINTRKLNCGSSYGKINLWEGKEKNNFLPILLNSYSDNANEETLKIDIDAGKTQEAIIKSGIHPMTMEDVLPVIYLEGSIYPTGLKDHMNNIQHHILASMINNELKQRENLSLVSYDNNNRINGYLLAYQGVMDKKDNNDPCIYVHDVAVDDTAKGQGLKMMMQLFAKAKQLDLPIIASLRESTSYQIITKRIESLGYTITQDKTRKLGGETFHDVVIKKKV